MYLERRAMGWRFAAAGSLFFHVVYCTNICTFFIYFSHLPQPPGGYKQHLQCIYLKTIMALFVVMQVANEVQEARRASTLDLS